jgi:hypothetical protein
MNLWRAGLGGFSGIQRHGEGVVIHLDQVNRILGNVPVFGNHARYPITHMPDFIYHEGPSGWDFAARHDPTTGQLANPTVNQILTGKDSDDAGERSCFGRINAIDFRMGIWTAFDYQIRHIGHLNIGDILPLALNKSGIFAPLHAGANVFRHYAPPDMVAAAA